jgi:formylglycine-generating enzyme required for sulfatase activity
MTQVLKVPFLESFFGCKALRAPLLLVVILLFGVITLPAGSDAHGERKEKASAGMVWIPGGRFTMGSRDDSSRSNEGPPHTVHVDGFWIDTHAVTNAEFEKFVSATGYVTTAEKAPTWEELRKQLPPGAPKPDDSVFVPGSMVFTPSEGPVDRGDMRNFWRWVPGANWRHPEGPGSSLQGRMDHPVVQVSWFDAVAYATWAGKRLPTEAEYEFAARGGLSQKKFPWGDADMVNGEYMANTWQGDFPYRNTGADGFTGTAPVKSFPPNQYGLYDMVGNVWQWCADLYQPDTFARRAHEPSCHNPTGPQEPARSTTSQREERVTKGGSFLCHISYCESYRPAARRGTPPDTGMSHIGFRCVKSAKG